MSSIVPIFQIYKPDTEKGRDCQMPHSQNPPEMSFELLSVIVQAQAMERCIFTLIGNTGPHLLYNDVRNTATHRMPSGGTANVLL